MATESPIRITETNGKWTSLKETVGFGSTSGNMAIEELGLLLKGQKFQDNGRDLVPNRSESAPPSMEGSFSAIENIISQQNFSMSVSLASLASRNGNIDSTVSEQLRAGPASLEHYAANVSLNPRLTPPLNSREYRRLVRHVGSSGNNKRLTSSDYGGYGSLHMSHSKLPTHKEEPEDNTSPRQALVDRFDIGKGFWSAPEATSSRQSKSAVDLIQEDFSRPQSPIYNKGRSLDLESVAEVVIHDADGNYSHNLTVLTSIPSTDDMGKTLYSDPPMAPTLADDISTTGVINSVNTCIESVNSISIPSSPYLDSHINQKDQQHIHQNSMPQEPVHQQPGYIFEGQNAQSQMISQGISHTYISRNQIIHHPSNFYGSEVQPALPSSGFTPPLYATAAANMTSSTFVYPNLHPSGYFSPQYAVGGYSFQPEAVSPFLAGYIPHNVIPTHNIIPSFNDRTSGASVVGNASHGVDLPQLNKFYAQVGFPTQPALNDPLHVQYFQQPSRDFYSVPYDHLAPRDGATGSQVRALGSQKQPDLAAFSAEQKLQHQGSIGHGYMNPGRVGVASPYFFGSPRNMGILQFPPPAVASPIVPGSPVGGTSYFGGRNEMRISPGLARNAEISAGWQGQRGIDDTKPFSILEELKYGKGRRFELSDISGHIVEFSADQHGSRFIQQKLENCSDEEKASVFEEVLPNTSKLVTDVFGNYVIQKFFEYGSSEQRKELANKLAGLILPLSLQMYGCRVIQKALEVIEMEQKIKLVQELDGHVMRCVRDQNGNHVIQKCIESIPTDKIEFIITSFRGQVATLSKHPYGCRVIQRVLEHCTEELQSQFIVDEILDSVRALAQDQYGNYVTQHVLERGKPQERSQIISKLSGHIVQLSQHKFASNVVEKCLEHGDSASLEIIIGEIVGHGDGNDNLLAMVKDQYANYVVQKILQTCSDDQRELLLGRIRTHLNSLKKYTYGKHIVTRFEQLYGEDTGHQDHHTSIE